MCLSCLSLIIVKEFNIVYDLEVHVCTYHVNDKVYKQLHFIVKLRKLRTKLGFGGLCLETWSQSTVSVIKVELQLIIIIVNLLGYYFYSDLYKAFCLNIQKNKQTLCSCQLSWANVKEFLAGVNNLQYMKHG